jgi:hypothetical protein
MIHAFHALQGAESLLITAARLWAAAGELITAGAILWALDALARAIRAAYGLGRATGRILWPVIHAVTAAARWAHARIDWREVALIVAHGLKVLAVFAYVAAVEGRRLLIAGSAALGRWYAGRLAPVAPVVIVPPAVHPMALIAGEMQDLTCRQLQAITGCRRKVRKAHLIALAVAC